MEIGILYTSKMNEEILFRLIKTRIPDLEKTNQFSYRDGYSPKYDLTIELKCRYTHYDNLLIEKMKYDKLIQNKRALYINSTPIGIFLFDLKKLPEPLWQLKYMPKQTEFQETYDIQKMVGYLNIYQATDLSHLMRRI
jgi:hypothetical protein